MQQLKINKKATLRKRKIFQELNKIIEEMNGNTDPTGRHGAREEGEKPREFNS